MAATRSMKVGKATRALVALVALLAVMSFTAGTAGAWVYEYSGKLAGKSWTAGNGTVWPGMEIQQASTSSGAICVGPVQYSGGWIFPYGWKCATGNVGWSYAAINAAAGTDNPNSGTVNYASFAGS
jgi:hypothetical protein